MAPLFRYIRIYRWLGIDVVRATGNSVSDREHWTSSVPDGRPSGGREAAIDASDLSVQFILQLLILLNVRARRYGHLVKQFK